MRFYVQYAETGDISATLQALSAPNHPRQLAQLAWVDTQGKRVNPVTRELEEVRGNG